MTEKIKEHYRNHPELFRYGIMAILVVSVEYTSYLALLTAMPYIAAVPVSMLIGIVMNWYFSRKYVFKTRRHQAHTEFILVFLVSLLGVGLQTITAYVVVTFLALSPELAKLFAILFTFFFNYFVRKKYIF